MKLRVVAKIPDNMQNSEPTAILNQLVTELNLALNGFFPDMPDYILTNTAEILQATLSYDKKLVTLFGKDRPADIIAAAHAWNDLFMHETNTKLGAEIKSIVPPGCFPVTNSDALELLNYIPREGHIIIRDTLSAQEIADISRSPEQYLMFTVIARDDDTPEK